MRGLRRLTPSFTFGRVIVEQQSGGVGLLLVVGVSLAMLVMGVTMAEHAKQSLRMALAETKATQSDIAIMKEFDQVALLADGDPLFPQTPDDGKTQCQPSSFPGTCREVLRTRITAGSSRIPVRVVWQESAGATPIVVYGWVLTDAATGRFQRVVYKHQWCTPSSDLLLGVCEQGG